MARDKVLKLEYWKTRAVKDLLELLRSCGNSASPCIRALYTARDAAPLSQRERATKSRDKMESLPSNVVIDRL